MRPVLLWDHNGVLLDTERWYFEASRLALETQGIGLTQAVYLDFMESGRPVWDLARSAGVAEADVELLRELRNHLYQGFLRSADIEIDGVAEVVADLAQRHRMAIVTTSRRSDFDLIHADRSLVLHFELVLTVEDYSKPKPAPDPYLAAIDQLGVGADEVLVIEDSSRGLASAVAAGLRCVVVRNEFTGQQQFVGAACVVDSIRDLPAIVSTYE